MDDNFRLLLVDEVAETREAVVDAVGWPGSDFSVYQADSAERALEMLESVNADALLTAVRMSGMGGIELLTRLRQSEEHAEIAVVAMSASDSAVVRRAVLEAGADAYLTKPFTALTLRAALDAALAARNRSVAGAGLPWLTAQSVLDAIPDFAMVLDERHQVLMANEAYFALVDKREGCPIECHMAVHADGVPEECPLREAARTGRSVSRRVANSLEGPLEVFVTPLVDLPGMPRAFLHVARPA